ncbi:hypothetical protein BT93_F0936 [Corymbia citriodora subsp. variegata]|nr:hypothetical protein BT93_F0936 [Corymbia citriodora subsp. variegata]KAF8023574.1 hypothetical protein BT93_F0936 [Corymbia citriodora subsp. variegata]
MGAVCSGGTEKHTTESSGAKSSGFSGKLKSKASFTKSREVSHSNQKSCDYRKTPPKFDSGELLSFSRELKPSKPSTPARKGLSKVTPKNSFIGKAGMIGFERAVDVLDTLGSSVSNLHSSGGFSGMASRGNKISILAFEVANTIVKGANLLQSMSEENIQFLKKEILHSEGVQQLVSRDMKELLSIAAADKREELDVFSREVIRFGDLCKDPLWHNLGRHFSRLDVEDSGNEILKSEAEMTMQELSTLAQHTSELYHELQALDRFEQDYRQRLEEVESLNLPRKGEGISMLQSELKHQKKLVKSLKKKSLWSRSLEEIIEKLVDIVTYIHQAICEAFGDNGSTSAWKDANKNNDNPQRLGVASLALHYANLINQIDTIASRPSSLPPNTRDTLYHGLPPGVKKALHKRMQNADTKEELSVSQVKAEMEKSLQWLFPIATNTIKAHQGFGWVGEWANNGNEFGKTASTNNSPIRLQTLYHADKQKVDLYILELITWLHHLIALVRHRDQLIFKSLPFQIQSSNPKGQSLHPGIQQSSPLNSGVKMRSMLLSLEDRILLNQVCRKRMVPGISKSQEFSLSKRRNSKVWALNRSTRSTGSSPMWEHRNSSLLDVIDGLE